MRQIDPGDEAGFSAWFAAYDAAQQHDDPGGPRWRERALRVVNTSTDYRRIVLWVAEDAGDPVGAVSLDMPLKDNPRLAQLTLAVRPDVRRRGIGTGLLTEAGQHAAGQQRSSLLARVSASRDGKPTPGVSFAERHGFTRRIVDIRRVQRRPFQLERLGELESEALGHAQGYQLVTWRDRVPDEGLAEYARLVGRMSTDTPLGDLDFEPELWDGERVRLCEQRRIAMGHGWWCTVAMAADETLAGTTEIGLPTDDQDAFQGDTIVDPVHRGHRLGLLLKIANLRALLADRPDVKSIWTWNAASNRYMISVNEKLGYVKAGWEAMYQRD